MTEIVDWRASDDVIVLFMGKTGSGKTTTINQLWGLNWPVDTAVACTAHVMAARVTKAMHSWLPWESAVIIDTPGIAESCAADNSRLATYREVFSRAHHIVWVFQADTRVFRPDQEILQQLGSLRHSKACVTIGLNRVDDIGPSNWNFAENEPSPDQLLSIKGKVEHVRARFANYLLMDRVSVVAYSAKQKYRLNVLRERLASTATED